jgi:tetratricopeptide (TPR) repeat protein
MAQIRLRTLGDVSLDGPAGPILLDEPRLVALVVLLAIAGPAGVSDDELMLRLTPDATAEHGRVELARLVAVARLRLGGEQSIVRTGDGYAFAPGLVTMDVRVLPDDAPSECAEFLAGFKLPGSPEFRDWLAETRKAVEPLAAAVTIPANADDSLGPVAKRVTRRRAFAAIAVVAMIVVASGLYLAVPRSLSGFATGDPLLVADVKNETGDSIFDVSVMTASIAALNQSGRIRLYPRSRLADVYRLMQIQNRDTALTFELAQDVAQRDGVRFVLGLQLNRVGDGYRVTARLADVAAPHQVVEKTASARTKNDVIGALDNVLLDVRRTLGETRREVADHRVPLPYVTTGSLEALRAYGEGSVAWTRQNYRLATELWRRAVDIDTGFAMAYGALGGAYYYGHNREQGDHYYAEALTRIGRLSEWERLRLLSQVASNHGNLDSAIIISGVLATRYPSTTTWYNHGTDLMRADRDSEAMVSFHKALSYNAKHVGSYINLATSANHLQRFDDALGYYRQVGQIDSLALYRGNINHEWGGVFVRLGRYAEAESAFNRMARQPDVNNRMLGLRSLGYLSQWRGQPEQAIDFFRQAVAASVQTKSSLSEARNRMLLATSYRALGRDREAADEVTKTLAMMNGPLFEPQYLALLATSCIKLGRVADAEAVTRVLRSKLNRDNPIDVGAEAYVAGLIALAKHHPDSALTYVRAAAKLPAEIQRATLEAEAFRQLGQPDSARLAVMRVINAPGFGREGQEDWLHAPLVLGDILLAQHDTAGAVKAYQRLLEQWRGAPAGLADVVATRTRLASLRAGGDRPRH